MQLSLFNNDSHAMPDHKIDSVLNIRGLGFKFVDFLYRSSDVCPTEIKMISSVNIFFCLSYKLLSIALLIIVSTQQ